MIVLFKSSRKTAFLKLSPQLPEVHRPSTLLVEKSTSVTALRAASSQPALRSFGSRILRYSPASSMTSSSGSSTFLSPSVLEGTSCENAKHLSASSGWNATSCAACAGPPHRPGRIPLSSAARRRAGRCGRMSAIRGGTGPGAARLLERQASVSRLFKGLGRGDLDAKPGNADIGALARREEPDRGDAQVAQDLRAQTHFAPLAAALEFGGARPLRDRHRRHP